MQQHSWFRASVLSAGLASVALACSSSDDPSNGGLGGASPSTAGAASAVAGSASGIAGNPPNTAGAANPGGNTGNAGSSPGGSSSTGGSNAGGSNAGGQTSAAGSGGAAGENSGGAGNPGGGSAGASAGPPTGAELIAKLGNCTKISGPYNPDGPSTGNIDVCKTGSAVWWKADLDVDCDGIQTPPCNTDNTGQPMTSIVDLAPSGDVDPTKLPYFVIPLGTPETEWYTPYAIELGQIGAVIYKGQVIYGIFADQAGGNFIGEASYEMCSLFIGANNCDPNNGGIDPLDVTYVTFTGATARASGQDIYNHDKHTALGEAAAKAWLAQ